MQKNLGSKACTEDEHTNTHKQSDRQSTAYDILWTIFSSLSAGLVCMSKRESERTLARERERDWKFRSKQRQSGTQNCLHNNNFLLKFILAGFIPSCSPGSFFLARAVAFQRPHIYVHLCAPFATLSFFLHLRLRLASRHRRLKLVRSVSSHWLRFNLQVLRNCNCGGHRTQTHACSCASVCCESVWCESTRER